MLIAAVIITHFSGMSVDAPPFTPVMPQPDYTSIMVEKSFNQEDASRIVTHHGRWTRIDRTRVQDLSHTSEYYSAASGARMTVSGQHSIILERKISSTPPGVNFEARNTGERQIYLGESCTVWDVWRTLPPVDGFSHLNCSTDDGITLWEKTLHGNDVSSSVEASRIERRPITLEEVQAPRALLTLDWWDTDLPSFGGPSAPDHEIVMESSGASSGAAKSVRTIRRLGPWEFLDETVGASRRILITHDSLQMQLQYISDQSGAPVRLAIKRTDIISESAHKLVPGTSDLNRSETILGETCRWFGMTPDVAGAGRRRSCLTSGGIMLKEVISGLGMSEQE